MLYKLIFLTFIAMISIIKKVFRLAANTKFNTLTWLLELRLMVKILILNLIFLLSTIKLF